jgi:hypothetical protein
MTVPARDRSYERGALDAAEAHAELGLTGYGERVLERLDRVGAKHGDRFATMAIAELLEEIAQEGLDAGGWALLTAEKAMLDGLTERVALPLRLKLVEIVAAGAQVEQLVNEARAIVGVTPV